MAKHYGRGPNDCERLAPLNDKARYLDTSPQGGIEQAGYERVERRPRVDGIERIMPEREAGEVEEIFQTPAQPFPGDY